MPELPEVEILARHLAPLLAGKRIRGVEVRRERVIAPTTKRALIQALRGARFTGLSRRGKYLIFTLASARTRGSWRLVGHLGMTGRMYLLPAAAPLPKHAAVVLDLGRHQFVFEDTRYFGRLTLDDGSLVRLGPEPLGPDFTLEYFTAALGRSSQAIKVKLLDQALVAGVGNIYASEALFRAGISPRTAARRLKPAQAGRLAAAIRGVLREAIAAGSTIPLDFSGAAGRDRLFYYGSAERGAEFRAERLLVYDRAGQDCAVCATPIRRTVQAARSTFFCPRCQRA